MKVVAGVLVAVLVAGVVYLTAGQKRAPSGSAFSGASGGFNLSLSFGITRNPITRSLLLNLCPAAKGSTAYPECDAASGGAGGADTRPQIVSTGFEADLAGSGTSQFPADQLTVSAANEGRQGLRVTVTADPRQPERIDSGTYTGFLIVQRDKGAPISIKTVVELEPRGGKLMTGAFGVLLVGALLGALVKWVNDIYGPLSALRRRARRLVRWLPPSDDLPDDARRLLSEIRETIRSVDTDGVAADLDALEKEKSALTGFGEALAALKLDVARQRAISAGKPWEEQAEALAAAEEARIEELKSIAWPWENAADVTSRLEAAGTQFSDATTNLQGASAAAAAQAAVTALAALAAGAVPAADPADAAGAGGGSPPTTPGVEDRNFFEKLLDNSWWVMLLVAAVAVAGIGFKLRFLDNDGFAGNVRDLAELFAWAFTIQLAGTTVVEAAGGLAKPKS